jgi:ketosteroid isomerase-like protein
MTDTAPIDEWIAAYRHAWSTDDPAEVAALFSEDVRYFTAPFRPPLTGLSEVVGYWLGEEESGLPWSLEYEVVARSGDLYVVRAVVDYPQGGAREDEPATFHDLWLITLGQDGRCREFIEYYVLEEEQ